MTNNKKHDKNEYKRNKVLKSCLLENLNKKQAFKRNPFQNQR